MSRVHVRLIEKYIAFFRTAYFHGDFKHGLHFQSMLVKGCEIFIEIVSKSREFARFEIALLSRWYFIRPRIIKGSTMKSLILVLGLLLILNSISAMYMADGNQGRFVWLPSNKKFVEEIQNMMVKEEEEEKQNVEALQRLFDANYNSGRSLK